MNDHEDSPRHKYSADRSIADARVSASGTKEPPEASAIERRVGRCSECVERSVVAQQRRNRCAEQKVWRRKENRCSTKEQPQPARGLNGDGSSYQNAEHDCANQGANKRMAEHCSLCCLTTIRQSPGGPRDRWDSTRGGCEERRISCVRDRPHGGQRRARRATVWGRPSETQRRPRSALDRALRSLAAEPSSEGGPRGARRPRSRSPKTTSCSATGAACRRASPGRTGCRGGRASPALPGCRGPRR